MCRPDDEEATSRIVMSDSTPPTPILPDGNDGAIEATLASESASSSSNPSTELVKPDNNPPGDPPSEAPPSFCSKVVAFYWEYEFLILVIVSIGVAKAYPPLGGDYLQPDITASWIAVVFEFFMAGLSLKTSELANALKQVYFNACVQVFNFGVVSSVVYGISRLLVLGNIIGLDLADGITIAASVPMTINTVQVMTKASGGDEAAAIFNAAFGNLVGVFLAPALILGYLGVTSNVDVATTFYMLAARVLLPLVIGQVLQYKSKTVMNFVQKNKKYFKQAQQYALVYIVYTVFCKTFLKNYQTDIGSVFIMIAFVFLILSALMVVAWFLFRYLFPSQPKLYIMALYGGTHKTVALGIPLISTIYQGSPALGSYTLPLIVWHSMQLLLGSLLAPRLSRFVVREEARLREAAEVSSSPNESPPVSSSVEPPHPPTSDDDDEQQQRAAEEGRTIAPTSTVIMTGTMRPTTDEDLTE